LRRLPVGLGDLVGGVVGEFGDDVAVGAEGEPDLGVAEVVHDNSGGDAHDEQGGGGGVSGVVQACGPYSGFAQELVPVASVGAGVDRQAGALGEQEAMGVPFGAGVEAFCVLRDSVRAMALPNTAVIAASDTGVPEGIPRPSARPARPVPSQRPGGFPDAA
jgi:hypothetical protein